MGRRLRLATAWLGGCSGCHMSFLDLDEFLIDLADAVDLVYTPLVDAKQYPDEVDIALIEGAVCNQEHLELARRIRSRTKVLISFGDCAVTGNVTAMRNPLGSAQPILRRSYLDETNLNPRIPEEPGIVPILLDQVRPLHAVVPVDLFLPGCPPPAARIRSAIEPLLAARTPKLEGREMIQFG
jgi:NAD-reducing hydrogenase small subunit